MNNIKPTSATNDQPKLSAAHVDAIVRVAVHHAVEACKAATGQRRVIDTFVNKTDIANEVLQAIRETAAEHATPKGNR